MAYHYRPSSVDRTPADQGRGLILWLCQPDNDDRVIPTNPEPTEPEEAIDIGEFGKCHDLDAEEIRKLQILFGSFASRHELWANVRRRPRFR